MARLRLDNIVKDYGRGKGVFGISLDIEDGEFFVLLGPSGCGKTTTLRAIAGLETVDSGHIYLNDYEITDYPPKDRDMAMVFQNYALYPFMTVRDNIAFPLKKRRMPKGEIESRVEEIAKILGISELLDMKPGQISGGQRQRVALGRAIVREPQVFLMDEPLSNLDAKLRTTMRSELKRLQRRYGTTTVYVTHDQVEAVTLGDRVAVLNNGRLEQLGRPMEIYERPKNVFVASFLGDPSINMLDARLEEKNGKQVVTVAGFSFAPEMVGLHTESINGAKLKFGVRPEDLQVSEEGIAAKVIVVQDLGRSSIEHYEASETGEAIVRVAQSSEKRSEGEMVHLMPNLSRSLVFSEDGDLLTDFDLRNSSRIKAGKSVPQ